MARLLVEQADFEGAVDAYARRIDVNPNSAEAHRQLGEIFVLLGRHDEALAEFAIAVWLDPGDARALAAAGQVHVRLLQYEEAVAALQPALAADPSLLEARYALGTALLRSGKAADGRRELELFERRQAEITSAGQLAFRLDALRRDATRALAAGDGARAVELFTEAAAIEPDSGRSHRDLGLALLREGRLADAAARLEEAARREPLPETYRHLADAYVAAGLAADAARARTQAADLLRQEAQRKVRELGGPPPSG
jgi:tetratricopeptide (TPR) repeat protein